MDSETVETIHSSECSTDQLETTSATSSDTICTADHSPAPPPTADLLWQNQTLITLTPNFTVEPVTDEDDEDDDCAQLAEELASIEDILTAEALQIEHSDSEAKEARELEDGELDDDEDEAVPVPEKIGGGGSTAALLIPLASAMGDGAALAGAMASSSADLRICAKRQKITAEDSWAKQVDHRLSHGKRRLSEAEEDAAADGGTDDNCVYVVGASPTRDGSPEYAADAYALSYRPMYGDDYLCLSPHSAQKRRRCMKARASKQCYYFLHGGCQKGDQCDYAHYKVPPAPLRMRLCRFYARECCAKRSQCKYLHKEFPCKIYHLGGRCFTDGKCKYSHAPLTDDAQKALIKHIVTGPSDILDDFPRLSREELYDKMEEAKLKRAKGEEPGFTFKNIDKTRLTHLEKEPTAEPPTTARASSSVGVGGGGGAPARRPLRPVSGGGRQPRSFVDTSRQRRRTDAATAATVKAVEGGSPSRPRQQRRSGGRRRRASRERGRRADRGQDGRRRRAEADVSHLPADQRQLYLRIHHNQRRNAPREETPQPSGGEDGEGAAEDSWYSSDEETSRPPLATVLKNISAQPPAAAPAADKQKSAAAADTMAMGAISDLLKQIQNSAQKRNITSLSKTPDGGSGAASASEQHPTTSKPAGASGWTTANFHDVFWGGELSPQRSPEKLNHGAGSNVSTSSGPDTSAGAASHEQEANVRLLSQQSSPSSAPTVDFNMFGSNKLSNAIALNCDDEYPKDVDMRVEEVSQRLLDIPVPPSKEVKEDEANSWPAEDIVLSAGTNDERIDWPAGDDLALPFKPVFLTPCIEIAASSFSHPPMFWQLREVHVQSVDYSRVRVRLGEALSRSDPRLRPRNSRNTVKNDTDPAIGPNASLSAKQSQRERKDCGTKNAEHNAQKKGDPRQQPMAPEWKASPHINGVPQDPRSAARQHQASKERQPVAVSGPATANQQFQQTPLENQHASYPNLLTTHLQQSTLQAKQITCQSQQTHPGVVSESCVQQPQQSVAEHYQHLERLGMLAYQQFVGPQIPESNATATVAPHVFVDFQQPPPPPPPVLDTTRMANELTQLPALSHNMTPMANIQGLPQQIQQPNVNTGYPQPGHSQMNSFPQQPMYATSHPAHNVYQSAMGFPHPAANQLFMDPQLHNQISGNSNQHAYGQACRKITGNLGMNQQPPFRSLGPVQQGQQPPLSPSCEQMTSFMPVLPTCSPVGFVNQAQPFQLPGSQPPRTQPRRPRLNKWQNTANIHIQPKDIEAELAGSVPMEVDVSVVTSAAAGENHMYSQQASSDGRDMTSGQPKCSTADDSNTSEISVSLDEIELPKAAHPPQERRASPVKLEPNKAPREKEDIANNADHQPGDKLKEPQCPGPVADPEQAGPPMAAGDSEHHLSDEAGNRPIFSPPKDSISSPLKGIESVQPLAPSMSTSSLENKFCAQHVSTVAVATSKIRACVRPPPPIRRAPLAGGATCVGKFRRRAAAGGVALASRWSGDGGGGGPGDGLLPTPPSLLGRPSLLPAVLARPGCARAAPPPPAPPGSDS